ncbi:probable sulfate transporter 3.3 [Selaginella moellendorffii]|uniref:probable sulfate transporter 3.3 n=1 Tax=Selaginella moellendorffii TaxID=88036 RepID=UPI000D1C823B|nr:probable sulfate transporter 3.3 [Selaginella moellendorffii]|eukprot:XP_024519239.1 probable sulfate transporter 3.3 [Selaginella moellendorffii]
MDEHKIDEQQQAGQLESYQNRSGESRGGVEQSLSRIVSGSSERYIVQPGSINVHSMQEVQRAPRKSAFRKLSSASRETLFPDDPFRHFKNQPPVTKLAMAAQYVFPILEWLPKYKQAYFKSDLIAGITIASLSIPQGIAYARLAGLPAVLGLYTCVVPPVIYALFGSSKDVAMGPEAVFALLLGSLVRSELGAHNESVEDHLRLAFMAVFFAGLFQAMLGFFRLGFVIDFLSHATTVGFMSGASLVVALQQFKGILGLTHFTRKSDIVSVVHSIFQHPSQWNWRTIVFGVFFISLLTTARVISKRKKRLFWVSAVAPVTSVALSTLIVFLTRADHHNVGIVGNLRKGLNPPSLRYLSFHGPFLVKSVKIGMVLGLVGLMQVILVGRTFASLKNYHIDGNKEMIASGMINLIGSCLSCMGSSAAMSRTAVNHNAGCKTPVSSIVMSALVMVTLVALTPLFHYTPNVILSVIIFCALVGLIDPVAAYEIWKVDKIDFLACMGAFFGVIFHSIPLGLSVAVGISVLKVLLHVTRPHAAILGKIPGTSIYRSIEQYPQAIRVPGILVVRIEAAIYFSNANYVRERIIRWIEQETNLAKASPLRFLVIDLSPVMSIDTSGIHAFVEIHRALKASDIQLVLANPGAEVIERLHRGGFVDILGQRWISLTVDDAVHYCSMQLPRDNNVDNHEDVSECDVIVQIIPKFGL